jgi:hypothetical protein
MAPKLNCSPNKVVESESCHNPTNNPKKTKNNSVGVVLLSVKNKPDHHHHTTTPGLITIRAVISSLGR